MPMTYKSLGQRFWEKVDRRGPNDCWLWTGAISGGYGSFNLRGKPTHAHRAAAILRGKRLSKETCVCHICDNPRCCNPAHFFYGTVGDNNADRHAKGRSRGSSLSGESHPRARLNWAAVLDIRSKALTRSEYARKYGLRYGSIRDVELGRTWHGRTESA